MVIWNEYINVLLLEWTLIILPVTEIRAILTHFHTMEVSHSNSHLPNTSCGAILSICTQCYNHTLQICQMYIMSPWWSRCWWRLDFHNFWLKKHDFSSKEVSNRALSRCRQGCRKECRGGKCSCLNSGKQGERCPSWKDSLLSKQSYDTTKIK